MKKILSSLIALTMLLSSFGVIAGAADIKIASPTETEIASARDFYVVGRINRKSAKDEPLNIRVNLLDANGETVRSIESNVGPDGLTPATYNQTDYEFGTVKNDNSGRFITSFTPPDIIFDGTDRDSIRNAYNKIVVRDNYFAAVIYGGATKDFDLKYEDKFENVYKDLTEGEYEIVVIALDLYGEEVARAKQKLTIGSEGERLITSSDLSDYADENNLILPNSLVGYWNPSQYIDEKTNNFNYTIPQRFLINNQLEFGSSDKVSVFLNYLDITDIRTNQALGSAVSSKADISYLYYDIGDRVVEFNFAGETLRKDAEIIKSKYDKFIQICRMENIGEEANYVDLNMDDGVVISDGALFYGLYSPMNPAAVLSTNTYKITNDVSKIKTVITNENDEIVLEMTDNAALVREDATYASAYEFLISVIPNEKMLEAKSLSMTVYALNNNGEEILESNSISLKVVPKGEFISGYDSSYWGKVFCDTVNNLGEAPSGNALNPDEHVTRGDFAAMVNRLLGYSVQGESKFSDLKEESVYYDDCITAREIGYMTGDEAGKVNASQLISREQAMIILARISGAEKGDKEIVFKDSDLISFWAKDYVNAMCSTGIVSGFDGYINPQKNITVAEAAALIIKTIKWMYSDDEILSVGVGNNFTGTDSSMDLSDIEMRDVDFIDGLTKESIIEFFNENTNAFIAVRDYLEKDFADGVYIGKVGKGLEVRDYKMGNILSLSTDATNLITNMSSYFVSFSLKYNPAVNSNCYFAVGKNADGKEMGIVYTESESVSGRDLEYINDNWYFYIQK